MSMPSYYQIALDGPKPHAKILKAFVKAMDNEWAETALIHNDWLPNPWCNYGFEESILKASRAFPEYAIRVYEEIEGGGCTLYEAKNGKLFFTTGKIVFDNADRSEYIPASLSEPQNQQQSII